MAEPVTIVIFEKPYPIPTDYKPLDAVLIYELTGMEYVEYLEALDDDSKDVRATPGLLGLTLWRANPGWSRSQVAAGVQRIGPGDWRVEGGEPDLADEGDVRPPGEASPDAKADTTGTKPETSFVEPAAI